MENFFLKKFASNAKISEVTQLCKKSKLLFEKKKNTITEEWKFFSSTKNSWYRTLEVIEKFFSEQKITSTWC